VSKAIQDFTFEEMVDQAATFGKDAFDNLSWVIAVDDPISADSQAMVASQPFLEWDTISPFCPESAKTRPDSFP
jgi:hypothetical protein